MATKEGAGGKQQNYDTTTGRYGSQTESLVKAVRKYSDNPTEDLQSMGLPTRHKASGYRAKRDLFSAKLKDKPDGTYDLETGEDVSAQFVGKKLWQVAFQTTSSEKEGNKLYISDEEYDRLVDEVSKETGSKPYLGKFEVPEISFVCDNFKKAKEIMYRYDQHSIWNWEKGKLYKNKRFNKKTNSVKGESND